MTKGELVVKAIKNGTVIDHIPGNMTLKVADILGLKQMGNMMSIAANLPSKSMGKKGLIKIADKSLTKNEVNKIALLAPEATVNIINNFEVTEKHNISIPKVIDKVVKCSSPHCITNHEDVETKFYVLKDKPLKIRCHYCERDMGTDDISLL